MKIDNSKFIHFNRSSRSSESVSQRANQTDQAHFEKQLDKKPKQSRRKQQSEEQPDTPSGLPNPFMLAANLSTSAMTSDSSVRGISEWLSQQLNEYSRQLSTQSNMQLTLRHPSLSNTQLTLSLTNNQLHVAFIATNKQQFDLLNQASASLKEQLAKRFGQVSIELGLSSETSYQQGARPDYIPEEGEE